MHDTWVIVADNSYARIFSTNGTRKLHREIFDMTNPAGRLMEQELTSDRHGRTYDSEGSGRHDKEPPTTSKDKESGRFARDISAYLESHYNEFDRLILICAPKFLGLLRKELDDSIQKRIFKEIGKDLVRRKAEEISRHLER